MLVQLESDQSSYKEWCLLEFQGEVSGELIGNELGKLVIKEDGKAEMDIGQHFLEGSVVKLKMPFLIVEKMQPDNDVNGNNISDIKIPIKGFVRNKIIFKTRPKPVGLKRPLE